MWKDKQPRVLPCDHSYDNSPTLCPGDAMEARPLIQEMATIRKFRDNAVIHGAVHSWGILSKSVSIEMFY